MTAISTVNIFFEDSGKWYSLPEWAENFIKIGVQIGSLPQNDSRIVTAIVLPTRAFAAAFVCLGMVFNNAAGRKPVSASTHFEKLFDLPPGSPVIFRESSGKKLKGVLQEPDDIHGELFVRVQVHSTAGGRLTHLINESQALQVQPARHSGSLPKKQVGSTDLFSNGFVDNLLGEADSVQLGLESKVIFALVGKKNALEHEIRKTRFAIHTNDNRYEGRLQDILRVKCFVTKMQSYRSAFVPIGPNSPSDVLLSEVETGVVFDGALGFLKWGEMWHDRHQVIILDRTKPYFDDAISAINGRFCLNNGYCETALPTCEAPPGGEVLMFRETIN